MSLTRYCEERTLAPRRLGGEAIQKTFSMMENRIFDFLVSYKQIFIAYSGGVDSHVLLHLLYALFKNKKNTKLTAVHVNHNLSPKAKKWDKHCAQVCKKLHINYLSKSIPRGVKVGVHSLEEILRKLRYEIFAKILPKDACLVTAHQADDQAETLLLQLFRGAGPKGLAAMPEKIKFAQGWLARPLLNYLRKDIISYATHHELKWVEDESNANIKFDRNFIRHEIMPLIKKHWPAIINTLGRASRHCFEAAELLNMLAASDLTWLVNKGNPHILEVNALKKLSQIRQKNVLRFWLHQLSLPLPSEVKLVEVIRTVIDSRYDAMPVVKWHGAEVRRFCNDLYAMPPLPLAPFDKKRVQRDFSKLKLKLAKELKLDPKKLKLGFRQGGEKVKLYGRQGSRDLKKLMQEWEIPPWLRDRVPLIYCDGKVVAAVGYYPK